MNPIYYSYRIKDELLELKDLPNLYGEEHRILLKLKDRVIRILELNDIKTIELVRPEIYKHEISFRFLESFQPGTIHIIFKPIEEMKFLKNAYNIAIINQNYTSIDKKSLDRLRLMQEIWTLHENTCNLENVIPINWSNISNEELFGFITGRFSQIKDLSACKI